MDHLAAGIDTVGDALCFLIHLLSLPSGRATQETLIRSLQENDDGEYLEAVILEGLRILPPIPMSQPRVVPAGGRVIEGCLIPEGTVVSAQAWSIHRLNEDVFGGDGEVFDPTRWLGKDEQLIAERKRALFAFGRGGRGCVGKL